VFHSVLSEFNRTLHWIVQEGFILGPYFKNPKVLVSYTRKLSDTLSADSAFLRDGLTHESKDGIAKLLLIGYAVCGFTVLMQNGPKAAQSD